MECVWLWSGVQETLSLKGFLWVVWSLSQLLSSAIGAQTQAERVQKWMGVAVPIKLYLQRQVVGWIWLLDFSLRNPAPESSLWMLSCLLMHQASLREEVLALNRDQHLSPEPTLPWAWSVTLCFPSGNTSGVVSLPEVSGEQVRLALCKAPCSWRIGRFGKSQVKSD